MSGCSSYASILLAAKHRFGSRTFVIPVALLPRIPTLNIRSGQLLYLARDMKARSAQTLEYSCVSYISDIRATNRHCAKLT